METAPLKTFATTARTQLMKEVTARLGIVLQESSLERRENLAAISQLEKAVQSEGAGSKGRRKVAERVAYTWFNRIIALRFMDANGYTDVGVVSPAVGQTVGQPEVLAEAKRGHIDHRIVTNKATFDRVTGLLNGTLTSDDPQREAYGVLLAAYCRHFNRAMSFMFEAEGNYTELLMPADLLSDESVIARAVSALTPEVCEDVEVIGWIYQFYIAERKDEVFAAFKKGVKAGVDEIPAATQLFTPDWIVRYLVENSLGRLWMLNRPESRLAVQMEYYIAPVEAETNYLKVASPEEIKILDPACGSGHMLTYAFDLLYAMYEEEGYAPNEIPSLILTNNLYGIEIDARAGALAAFALTMKARAKQRTFLTRAVEPNICVLEPISFTPGELDALVTGDADRSAKEDFFNQFAEADTLGSLICPREGEGDIGSKLAVVGDTDLFVTDTLKRASRVVMQTEYLACRYHVVVANPPYMGSKNMNASLVDWAKNNWPDSKSNLFAMFIERCLELARPRGLVGMITMQGWMFLSTYETLRAQILRNKTIATMVHLGTGAFDTIGGEVVSTTAFVLVNGSMSPPVSGVYVRVVEEKSASEKANLLLRAVHDLDGTSFVHVIAATEFRKLPGSPLAYWTKPNFRAAFRHPDLGRLVRTEGQNKTANNEKYLRRTWEVNVRDRGSHRKWIPYAKGGSFRRWYGNVEHLVDWSDAARREYRRNPACRIVSEKFWYLPGITWTDISTNGSGFRFLPAGGTFDMSGPTVFLDDEACIPAVLGFLNSGFSWTVLGFLNPTSHIQLKDVKGIPFPEQLLVDMELRNLAQECIDISRRDWDGLETSLEFQNFSILMHDRALPFRQAATREVEGQIACGAQIVEIEDKIEKLIDEEVFGEFDAELKSERPVSLLGNLEYRFGKGILSPPDRSLALRVVVTDFISYAVGCMFGRFSLDAAGLILANQGDTIEEYLAQVPAPSFAPDADNVIPILGDDWFDDDIVDRFRKFLRASFGDGHFDENLRFIEGALGNDLRKYFVTDFYKDHVQRYKKRPIYWLFSSPRGSFNALIYMHRYTPSTASTVLNEYLREFQAKLRADFGNQQRISGSPSTSTSDKARADKEVDRIRKMLLDVEEYEHDVLYPLATQQIRIDLDDGVKVNYSKFGSALKKIPGLESVGD
jgi:hypothetical protein